ncbi:MAG: DUF11 domain-containing protein, partial [Proteobacteria bacterium]|nr:DUF11 domain-containing protein [Pseudomonadota bacterium]
MSNPSFEIAWTNLGNIVSDNDLDANTDKVPSGFDNNEIHSYLRSRNYGFTIPAGETILGIEVQVEVWDANATLDMDDSDARLAKADVPVGADRSIAGVWPSTRTVRTYGSPTDLWGTTWTPAEVNAVGFGFALQPRALSGGTGAIAQVDYHRIIVYYTGGTPTADLDLTKTDSADPVPVSTPFTYTLTATNNGPDAANNVTLVDTLPATVAFQLAT